MNIKKDMKENTNKANNLRLGAIYINNNTGQPTRLVHVVPCEGAWLESYDGQGYGDTVKFEDVHYADSDEVQDFLDDHAVWSNHTDAPSFKDDSPAIYPSDKGYKPEREFAYGKEIVRDEDGSAVIGWYDDNDGNDYRCRD